MIELSNRRVVYTIKTTGEDMKLSGKITEEGDGRVSEFSGQFTDVDETWYGNFWYSENTNGKANQNINEVAADKMEAASALIKTAVEEFKSRTE